MKGLTSGMNLTNEAINKRYSKLKRLDSKNDLLKYLIKVTPEGFEYVGEVYTQFLHKFERLEDRTLGYVNIKGILANYYSALIEEIHKIKEEEQSRKMQISLKFVNKVKGKKFKKTLVNSLGGINLVNSLGGIE